jgi:hypothetical protein
MPIVQATRASDFVSSIGVNTHVAYYNTAYANIQGVVVDLQYLGINHVRDSAPVWSGSQAWFVSYEIPMAAGIEFDLVIPSDALNVQADLADLNALETSESGGIDAVEGINEAGASLTYDGLSGEAAANAFQAQLVAAVDQDPQLQGVQVYNYTAGTDVYSPSTYTQFGNISADANDGNAHVYAGYQAPTSAFWFMKEQLAGTPNDPFVVTETGYDTMPGMDTDGSQGVNDDVQAKYTLDDIFDLVKAGASMVYMYELLDESPDPKMTNHEDHFGLFNNDGTPKKAAVSLHDLTTILADDGGLASSFSSGTLAYSISNLPSTGNSMLLEKSDGSFYLAVWAEPAIWNPTTLQEIAVASTPVTVNLGQVAGSVEVYDPLIGTAPIASYMDVSEVTLGITDHPLIIEIDPVTAPAPLVSGSGPDRIQFFVSGVASSSTFYIGVGSGNPNSGGTVTPELTTTANQADNTQQEIDIYGTFNPATAYHFGIAGMAGETIDVNSVVYQGVTSAIDAQFADTGDSNNDGFGFEAYGTPTNRPVSVGSGPDSITLYLQGNEGDVHYEVGVNSEAWSDYQQTAATSADGETQEITLYGSFQSPDYLTVVLDDGQSSSTVPAGGGIIADPNQTLTVKDIVYNGTTITENTTITATQFAQSFTIGTPVTVPSTIQMTQFAAPAMSGLLATPLVTYNWDTQTQLASFLTAEADGTASIEFMGDSTTTGIGGDPSNLENYAGGYPEETAYWLNQDGITAQDANFLGNNNSGGDSQVSFTNGGYYSSAEGIAGEEVLLPKQGATMTFDPTNPIYGNTITTQLFGNYTGDQVLVTVNGSIIAGTLTVSNSGTWNNNTLKLAQATTIESITYTEITPGTSTPVFIEGTQSGNTALPAVQVMNSGISGGTAQADNYQEQPGDFGNGSGELPTTIQLDPSLVVINYGLNDLLYYGNIVPQIIGYLDATIKDLQAAGEDVILCSPTPFNAGPVTTAVESQFVSALQALSVSDNVGLIDLNDTYGQDLAALQAAGGISSNPGGVHPDAILYANIGKGIASLLANAIRLS